METKMAEQSSVQQTEAVDRSSRGGFRGAAMVDEGACLSGAELVLRPPPCPPLPATSLLGWCCHSACRPGLRHGATSAATTAGPAVRRRALA